MKQVELSQQELRIIVSILCTVSYKLGDAKVTLPIVEKLESFFDPEPETVVTSGETLTHTN